MIFVSIGTTKFGFGRLLMAIDRVMFDLNGEEDLVVQLGSDKYRFNYKYAKVFKETGFGEMISYIKKARVFIVQGGPATIFQGLEYGHNLPLVVPRSGDLGEHVNNHQIMFVKRLVSEKKALAVFPEEDLKERIQDYLKRPIINKKTTRVVDKRLVDYLDSYTGQVEKTF